MKRTIQVLILLASTVLVTGPALADDLYVFPAKGQSQQQTERDKYDCYNWGKRQTGFDPMQAPKATAPPPRKRRPQQVHYVVLHEGQRLEQWWVKSQKTTPERDVFGACTAR